MKQITLRQLMEQHEPAARTLAEQHQLGPLQSRSYEGKPTDSVRTAVVTFRFARATIIYDGSDYRIERNTT